VAALSGAGARAKWDWWPGAAGVTHAEAGSLQQVVAQAGVNVEKVWWSGAAGLAWQAGANRERWDLGGGSRHCSGSGGMSGAVRHRNFLFFFFFWKVLYLQ
jgi:hypothetical protein